MQRSVELTERQVNILLALVEDELRHVTADLDRDHTESIELRNLAVLLLGTEAELSRHQQHIVRQYGDEYHCSCGLVWGINEEDPHDD